MVIALVASGFGCGEPYRPAEHTEALFPLVGGHALASCEGCHGPPPFGPIVWDVTCLSCHEADRKTPDHYPGQGCASGGCHAEAHLTWAEAAGGTGVNHDFLPLEGTHAVACDQCHASAAPSAADALGTSDLCWSCHEQDRKDALHYVETSPLFAAEPRWDCKACHDAQSRVGAALAGWGNGEGDHGNVRFPHGMVSDGVAQAQEAWVTDCAACHPVAPPVYACTESCHGELFLGGVDHYGALPGEDFTCLGCHAAADLR